MSNFIEILQINVVTLLWRFIVGNKIIIPVFHTWKRHNVLAGISCDVSTYNIHLKIEVIDDNFSKNKNTNHKTFLNQLTIVRILNLVIL